MEISEEIDTFTTETVFESSRYIFTTRTDKEEYGYCTHCKAEFKTNRLKHNSKHTCPNCGSNCTVKQSWRGRKYLQDRACFMYYEKSLVDPDVLIAKGFYTVRNYSGDYKNVYNQFSLEAVYIFASNESKMLKRYFWGNKDWEETKSIYSFNINSLGNYDYFCSYESIKEAVKDTRFKYSTYENYLKGDMLKFFELYNKYPLIEHLTKVDLSNLVRSKLDDRHMYRAINWRGKDIFKMLKINKKDLRDIRESNSTVTPLFLKLYQMSKKEKSNLQPDEIKYIEHKAEHSYSRLIEMLKYTTLRKSYKYLKKQDGVNNNGHFYDTISTWNDYINDCKKLQMDLTKENILFPKNLYKAHQNTIKQVKIKANKELNKKIKKRAKSLEKLSFKYNGLLIRPAQSTEELISEGKVLSHCVGTYADRYAKGETSILLVRNLSESDKPFYTVEIKNSAIVQVRGKDNCNPTDRVTEFIEVFTEEKLNTRKAKSKMAISA